MEYKIYKNRRKNYTTWRRSIHGSDYVKMLRKQQCNLCFICLFPLEENVHIDHITPLYNGGTNVAMNLSLAHPKCNMSKGISELLSKEEIKWRNSKLVEIRAGIKYYRLSMQGKKPHGKEIDWIILADEYVDLPKVSRYWD